MERAVSSLLVEHRKAPPFVKRGTEAPRGRSTLGFPCLAPIFVRLSQFAGECRLRYVEGRPYPWNCTNPEPLDDGHRAFIGTLERS